MAHRFTSPPAPTRRSGQLAERAWYNDSDFAKALSGALRPGEVKLTSPALQDAWVSGAVGLAARMLGNVPFVIVRADQEAEAAYRARVRAARTQAEFRAADELAKRARRASPFRGRDALLAGNLRAPEQALERLADHPLQRLFERPSPEVSRSEIWQAVVTWLLDTGVESGGNALFRLVGAGSTEDFPEGEVPGELWPHSRRGWEVERDKISGLITRWKFTAAGQAKPLFFEPHQIVLFRLWSAEESFWGRSPLAAADERMFLTLLGLAYNKALLKNGAMPSGVINLGDQNASSDEIEAILKAWEARHGGALRQGRPAVLKGGMKWEPAGLSQKDMEYGLMLDANRDAALASLAIHKAVLGADAANYAVIRDARRMVWTNVLLPIAGIIEEALYRTLFSRIDGGRAWGMFDFSGVEELREDLSSKALTFGQLVGPGRVPYNHANDLLGMGLPAKGGKLGEEAMVTVGLVPESLLEDPFAGLDDGGGDPTPPTGAGDQGGGGSVGDGEKAAPAVTTSRAALLAAAERVGVLMAEDGEILAAVGERIHDGFRPGERAEPGALKNRPDHRRPEVSVGGQKMPAADWWRGWWTRSGQPFERTLQAKLRRHWYELREEQLRRLKAAAAAKKSADGIEHRDLDPEDIERFLFEEEKWAAALFGVVEPSLKATALQQLKELKAELGKAISFKLTNPAWKAFMEQKEIKVADISNRVREDLRGTLAEGIEAGETTAQLQDRVRQVFNGAAQPYRTLRIARTEVASAANGVRSQTFRNEGVTKVQWITSNDDVVRASHQDCEAAGEQDLSDKLNWVKLSSHAKGSTLRYPSDPDGHPAEIVNCRCVLVSGD